MHSQFANRNTVGMFKKNCCVLSSRAFLRILLQNELQVERVIAHLTNKYQDNRIDRMDCKLYMFWQSGNHSSDKDESRWLG